MTDLLVRALVSGIGSFVGVLAGFLLTIIIRAITGSPYITPLNLVLIGMVAGSTGTWLFIEWPKLRGAMK